MSLQIIKIKDERTVILFEKQNEKMSTKVNIIHSNYHYHANLVFKNLNGKEGGKKKSMWRKIHFPIIYASTIFFFSEKERSVTSIISKKKKLITTNVLIMTRTFYLSFVLTESRHKKKTCININLILVTSTMCDI